MEDCLNPRLCGIVPVMGITQHKVQPAAFLRVRTVVISLATYNNSTVMDKAMRPVRTGLTFTTLTYLPIIRD